MASDNQGISAGQVFDCFVKLAKKEDIPELYTNANTVRKFLPADATKSALDHLDITFYHLLQQASPSVSLNKPDADTLNILESLDPSALKIIRRFIRSLQQAWWPQLESRSISNQLMIAATVRAGHYKRWDPEKHPLLADLQKWARVKTLSYIPTDSLWNICEELDVPICTFSRWGKNFPYYSRNNDADMTFCEYKFLDASLRPIVRSFVANWQIDAVSTSPEERGIAK